MHVFVGSARMHTHTSHMQVTSMSHPALHDLYTLTTHPLHGKLRPLKVHDADGPIATLSNTPLYSLSGGEGQEGPHLNCSNFLCGGSMLKITMQRMMKHLCTVNATLHTRIAT